MAGVFGQDGSKFWFNFTFHSLSKIDKKNSYVNSADLQESTQTIPTMPTLRYVRANCKGITRHSRNFWQILDRS
jgi:hypothetical protein